MCGEHSVIHSTCELPSGSSPHVRGARAVCHSKRSPVGIIPACAGSTCATPLRCCCHRDHPRMCGEHRAGDDVQSPDRGSSPHVRGAQNRHVWNVGHCGIIPACAGSTPGIADSNPMGRDHPRMCGEHLMNDAKNKVPSGSSPHVRGAPHEVLIGDRGYGIIPACAGSTQIHAPLPLDRRDHPRMCGEHNRLPDCPVLRRGSSPHVRGAPARHVCRRWSPGIIPACAGSTPPAP